MRFPLLRVFNRFPPARVFPAVETSEPRVTKAPELPHRPRSPGWQSEPGTRVPSATARLESADARRPDSKPPMPVQLGSRRCRAACLKAAVAAAPA